MFLRHIFSNSIIIVGIGSSASLIFILSVFNFVSNTDPTVAATQVTYDIVISVDASNPQSQNHYDPPLLPNATDQTINVGDTVRWKNTDHTFHTVTSGDPSTGPTFTFDSGLLSPGQNYTFNIPFPGIFKYYCTVHPFMQGAITVP